MVDLDVGNIGEDKHHEDDTVEYVGDGWLLDLVEAAHGVAEQHPIQNGGDEVALR